MITMEESWQSVNMVISLTQIEENSLWLLSWVSLQNSLKRSTKLQDCNSCGGVIVSLQGVQKCHLVKSKKFIGSEEKPKYKPLSKDGWMSTAGPYPSLHALKAVCLNLPLNVRILYQSTWARARRSFPVISDFLHTLPVEIMITTDIILVIESFLSLCLHTKPSSLGLGRAT